MKSTFKLTNGGALVVEPSPTKANIWITQAAHAGEPARIIAIPLHLAALVAQALDANATMIEESCAPAEPAVCNGTCPPSRFCRCNVEVLWPGILAPRARA